MVKQKFNGLKDLQSYAKGRGSASSVAAASQMLETQLIEAGEALRDILYKNVEAYYNSYDPKTNQIKYVRTYDMLKSIRLSKIQTVGTSMQIKVYFDEDIATHKSLWGGNPGFTPILISEGFRWKNNPGIYRFSYYDGYNFIEKSVSDFQKISKYSHFQISKNVY